MNLEQKDFTKVPYALAWIQQVFQDPNNWTKGQMFLEVQRYWGEDFIGREITACCTIGAVFLATRDPGCREELLDALRSTPTGQRYSGVSLMNDRGGFEVVQKCVAEACAVNPIEA